MSDASDPKFFDVMPPHHSAASPTSRPIVNASKSKRDDPMIHPTLVSNDETDEFDKTEVEPTETISPVVDDISIADEPDESPDTSEKIDVQPEQESVPDLAEETHAQPTHTVFTEEEPEPLLPANATPDPSPSVVAADHQPAQKRSGRGVWIAIIILSLIIIGLLVALVFVKQH